MGGETIGSRIAKIRKNAGYSQERFAEAIGLSRKAVVNIENDEAVPKADTLTEICRTLHVSADELLFGESNTEQFSKTMERIQLLDIDLQNRFFEMSSVFLTGLETIQADRNEK